MLKINQKNKKDLQSFLNLLIITLIIIFTRSNIVYGANDKWVQVSQTDTGIKYIDRNSFNYKDKGIIEITSKYLKSIAKTSEIIEENIFTTEINCLTNKFKDVSVNGKKNLTAEWEDPNVDKLINDLISNTCKNV